MTWKSMCISRMSCIGKIIFWEADDQVTSQTGQNNIWGKFTYFL